MLSNQVFLCALKNTYKCLQRITEAAVNYYVRREKVSEQIAATEQRNSRSRTCCDGLLNIMA